MVWQLASPARAIHHYPTREDNMLVCDSYVDASYTIAFFYPVVLIIVCTVYAVLTRKIPEAFNESKHIGRCIFLSGWVFGAIVKNDRTDNKRCKNLLTKLKRAVIFG